MRHMICEQPPIKFCLQINLVSCVSHILHQQKLTEKITRTMFAFVVIDQMMV